MAVLWNPTYLAVRTTLWWLLWAFANVYGCLYRKARGRGWKLHWGVRVVLTVQAITEAIRLGTRDLADSTQTEIAHDTTYRALVFFNNLSKAVFMGLLLLVASGYCITRNSLGPHRLKVTGIPIVYGVTGMIVDYILLENYSSVITQKYEEQEVRKSILYLSMTVWTIVFVLSWLYVFDNLAQEIKMLKGREQEEEPHPLEPVTEAEAEGYSRPDNQNAVERDDGNLLRDGQNASHLGGTGETDLEAGVDKDPEDVTTVADVVANNAKLKLLTRFFNGTLLYVLASVIVQLLPLYISRRPIVKLQDIMEVLQDGIKYVFLGILTWIFRPVHDNPYLMLAEDLDVDDEDGPTTELGVIVSEENQPGRPTSANPRPTAAVKVAEIDENFALEDDEDLSELTMANPNPVDGSGSSPVKRDGSPKRIRKPAQKSA